ncbi:hypothetical protein, conserved [Trypanosoma brucei gambiense DAL972]|uniref:Transmembrane protein n=2 Tax=Trypanosoma brucei TaxID=5691 RepID=D0A6B6_TRYB9|nr:hypothetical protein, conserved [Trypanosoma brucei gambiense DAL972]RHW67665.1 hypothetical protein DPX39_110036900 [Trypanosoma brucei equiperdum]CBH17217.1 hypothetical protein, conserved [Trypanosoma brucei gambiense DAL972]|eukprot:XP_011779481.1 hypothetical protein, conserved [Trypanosoma brucei gambiense DAL972]
MHGRNNAGSGVSPSNISTDVSGAFEYLDRYCSSGVETGFGSRVSSRGLSPLPDSPVNNVAAPPPGRWVPIAPPAEMLSSPPAKDDAAEGVATRLWRYIKGGMDRVMENMLEPNRSSRPPTNASGSEPILEVVRLSEPFPQGAGSAVASRGLVYDDNSYLYHEEDEEDELDMEDLDVRVDLSSALRAYRKSPNECFGHLVAAALAGRSVENPVTAEELKEARLNPYLVRMLLESNKLNLDDYNVQQELQRCIDALISTEVDRVPQAVFEYLLPLFKPRFVRLDAEQYSVVESSGFEFVQLLYECPHLFTGSKHFIRMNNACCGWHLAVFVMVISALAEVLCNVGIALVSVHWLTSAPESYYALYTAIVYGAGYASHLIAMILLMRARERNRVFGNVIFPFPSPHLHVLPVVPLYNIVSIVTYVRYCFVNRGGLFVDIIHDITAAQVLSTVCFCLCLAVPQFMCQMYLVSTVDGELAFNKRYPFRMLSTAVCATYLLALLRLCWIFTTQTSINNFGFACYSFHSKRIIQRYSALLRMVYAASLFLLELNVFIFVVTVTSAKQCHNYEKMVLSAMSIVSFVAIFVFLVLRGHTVFRIAWALIPLTGLQIALVVHKGKDYPPECPKNRETPEYGRHFQILVCFVPLLFLVLWLLQLCYVFVVKKRICSLF